VINFPINNSPSKIIEENFPIAEIDLDIKEFDTVKSNDNYKIVRFSPTKSINKSATKNSWNDEEGSKYI